MTEATKTFSLRTVLYVTTGRLLTEPKGERDNGIGDVYEILNWITMDNLFTHQLGRAMNECKPILLEKFPELGFAEAAEKNLDIWLAKSPTCPEEGIKIWITEIKMMCPALKDEYEIGQYPIVHQVINPVEEMRRMAPDKEVIVIEAPNAE